MPVWCCSAHTHFIDSVLNDALRIVTGCLCPTRINHLPILSGIQPAELCQIRMTLSLAHHGFLDPYHILYGLLSGSSDTRQVRLRSRCPFVSAAWNLLDNLARLGIHVLNGQTTNGKQSTVKMLPGSVFLCLGPAPGLLGWVYPKQLGLSSTTCGLVLGNSIRPCTNEVLLLPNFECGAPKQTASNSVPYASGTIWRTRFDGFG